MTPEVCTSRVFVASTTTVESVPMTWGTGFVPPRVFSDLDFPIGTQVALFGAGATCSCAANA